MPTRTRPVRDLEEYARRARAERALYIAELLSSGVFATTRVLGRAFAQLESGVARLRRGGRLPAKRRLATR